MAARKKSDSEPAKPEDIPEPVEPEAKADEPGMPAPSSEAVVGPELPDDKPGDAAEPVFSDEPVTTPPPMPEPQFAQEDQPAQAETPVDPPVRRRRGIGGSLVLAVVLGALGVGAGYLLAREGGPLSTGRIDALESGQADVKTGLADLDGRLASTEAAVSDVPKRDDLTALTARIEANEKGLADLRTAIDSLSAELEELRQHPPAVPDSTLSEEAVAAYKSQLEAMRQMFQGELEKVRAEADASAKAAAEATRAGVSAEALAALADLNTALDSGAGFAPILDQLAAVDATLPVEPLRSYEGGIPSLMTLQKEFPAAARAELSVHDAEGEGIIGFVKAQLGMRSLSPKSGDGVDAILSRAEAALRAGGLRPAIEELKTLPEPRSDAMTAWLERAETRSKALAAYDDLARKVQS